MNGAVRIAMIAALVGAPLAACSDDEPGPGEAHLDVDGEAVVVRADGDRETVDGSTEVRRGDRVSVHDGTAVMRLRGGTTFELREGLATAADTTVLMDERPVLEAGDLLVASEGTARVAADGTDVDVVEGVARVTRAFGMSVSAYDADVELDSAGVGADVPALREMVVPDLGRPPRAPRPFRYEAGDPWDQRYLGAAMALGSELQALADQLTGMLPEGEGRTPGFFELLLPGLEDEADFGRGLLEAVDPDGQRDQGDTLIGAAITDLGERGRFADRWSEVFEFRDQGAEWGIVALDQAVRSEPLIGTVEDAFNTSFGEVAAGPTRPTTSPGTTGDGGTGGATPPPAGSRDDGGDTEPMPPTTAPPVPPPSLPPPLPPPTEPPPTSPLDPVVDDVDEVVDDLLGGLLG